MSFVVPTNVAANVATTASKSLFMDVPKDGRVRGRVLPAVTGSEGRTFYLTENHFRLKGEPQDGQDAKGIAVACNKRHNPKEPCVICAVVDVLKTSDDPVEKQLGDSRESIKANRSWYMQFLPNISDDPTNAPEYGDLKLLRLPKTGAEAFNEIIDTQKAEGEPLCNDMEQGRDITFKRKDTGVQFTKYTAMTSGMPGKLDDADPIWQNKIIKSAEEIWEKIDLTIMTADEQKACLVRSYPDLDWEAIFKEAGV